MSEVYQRSRKTQGKARTTKFWNKCSTYKTRWFKDSISWGTKSKRSGKIGKVRRDQNASLEWATWRTVISLLHVMGNNEATYGQSWDKRLEFNHHEYKQEKQTRFTSKAQLIARCRGEIVNIWWEVQQVQRKHGKITITNQRSHWYRYRTKAASRRRHRTTRLGIRAALWTNSFPSFRF